jgi:hypothetical protein
MSTIIRFTEVAGAAMTPEAQSDQPPTTAQSAAKRMRAYRRRRRHGLRRVQLEVGRAELHGLIARGYLSPDKREDLDAIKLAIDDLMFDCFNGAFRYT